MKERKVYYRNWDGALTRENETFTMLSKAQKHDEVPTCDSVMDALYSLLLRIRSLEAKAAPCAEDKVPKPLPCCEGCIDFPCVRSEVSGFLIENSLSKLQPKPSCYYRKGSPCGGCAFEVSCTSTHDPANCSSCQAGDGPPCYIDRHTGAIKECSKCHLR